MATTLRELLNEAQWKTGQLHAWRVDIVHRGAPDDRRTVVGSRIVHVTSVGVEVFGDDSDSDTVFLPYHRFLQVCGAAGQVVWAKGVGFSAQGLAAEAERANARTKTGAAASKASGEAITTSEVRSDVSVVIAGRDVLTIDGAAGEGGGQILRSSLTLSMLTGRPVVIDNIRAGRSRPGLMRQHLTCVKAAAQICGAKVTGDTLKSTQLSFTPGAVKSGDVELAVGTAGSVALVLQTILLPLCLQEGKSVVKISGGTHARWAPPWPFVESSFLPLLGRMGASIEAVLHKSGFYPAGGGAVEVTVGGGAAATYGLSALFLPERRGGRVVELTAVVANLPEGIARRELVAASKALGAESARLSSKSVRSRGPGTAIWLQACGEQLTNVFTAIGDTGVTAEEVGQACASRYLAWRDMDVCVDEHLADQLMLPMALAGAGSFTTVQLTPHSWTNIAVIEAFTGRRLQVFDEGEGRYSVVLKAQ